MRPKARNYHADPSDAVPSDADRGPAPPGQRLQFRPCLTPSCVPHGAARFRVQDLHQILCHVRDEVSMGRAHAWNATVRLNVGCDLIF
eukprot:COSAG05_NODE_14_length_36349_cov_27.641655_7_plen_88_part_00